VKAPSGAREIARDHARRLAGSTSTSPRLWSRRTSDARVSSFADILLATLVRHVFGVENREAIDRLIRAPAFSPLTTRGFAAER
jgi:hypothetical protein